MVLLQRWLSLRKMNQLSTSLANRKLETNKLNTLNKLAISMLVEEEAKFFHQIKSSLHHDDNDKQIT